MKIAVISDITTHFIGGVGKSTMRFANELVKKGHKIIILTSKPKGFPEKETKNKIKFYRFKSTTIIMSKATQKESYTVIPSFNDMRRIKKIFKKENIDLISIQQPTYIGLLALICAKLLKIPIIAYSHLQPENFLLNIHLNNKLFNEIIYRYIVLFYNQANIVICPTKFSKDILVKRRLKTKTIIISNGVDLTEFKPRNTANFKKKYKIKKTKTILYVGRLMEEKNITILIDSLPLVLKKIPNTKLIIVGVGGLLPLLIKKAKDLKIQKNVIFIAKKLSEKALSFIYSACDLFVLPSLIELESIATLEAMACGKPVIVAKSSTSAAPTLIKNGKNGYVFKPNNEKDLANKIIKILSNKKLKKKMEKESLRIAKKHDIKKSVNKLEKVYSSLI